MTHEGIKPVTLMLLILCSDQQSSWIKRKPKSHTKLWAGQAQEGTLIWKGHAVGHDAWKQLIPWDEAVPQQPSWAVLALKCLSTPRAGPSGAGSSGTVAPWQGQVSPGCATLFSAWTRRPNVTLVRCLQWQHNTSVFIYRRDDRKYA